MSTDHLVFIDGNEDYSQILTFHREPNIGELITIPGSSHIYKLKSITHKSSDNDIIPPQIMFTLVKQAGLDLEE